MKTHDPVARIVPGAIGADDERAVSHTSGNHLLLQLVIPRNLRRSGTAVDCGKLSATGGSLVLCHSLALAFIFCCRHNRLRGDGVSAGSVYLTLRQAEESLSGPGRAAFLDEFSGAYVCMDVSAA